MKTTKTIIGIVTGCLMGGLLFQAWAVDPSIDNVVVRQRWPWSRLVDIDYALTCDSSTQRVDIVLSATDGSDGLTLPSDSLSGDIYGVSGGFRRIVWNPLKSAYTNQALMQFRVGLTPTNIPLYMIVDLTKTAPAAGQIEYVYEEELVTNKWGSWERDYIKTNGITVVNSIIWTGVTNDALYKTKTDKLVLRRVSAGSFKLGGTTNVKLTKECYVGVFEVTQRQYELVAGSNPSWFNNTSDYKARPVEGVSYNGIRGATNDTPSINWPRTGHAVKPGSFMDKLRVKTGIDAFDLPTEAQWEYACRAGTTTAFNDGDGAANTDGVNAYTNTWLNALGRYTFDGGFLSDGVTKPLRDCGATNGTAIVGYYRPNAWGLYDMHGNEWELCLDWQVATFSGDTDPTGPEASPTSVRVRWGGCWSDRALYCPSAFRSQVAPERASLDWIGFRVVVNLP